ncbi:MAG: superoxide dismutase [Erythrobacter sp.]|nr:superoxide dismutase [Erythrobacter sp.]
MDGVTRRAAIGTATIGGLGLALAAKAQPVAGATAPPAFSGAHQPKPLTFDPARLDGLSEHLIRSHWENNYLGSVKALNMIEARLAAAMIDREFPPVIYGGLKREQLHRTGSVILHEIYFRALGGNGKAAGDVRTALAASHGSFEAWEAEFRRTAMALAGGSGWCVLAFNLHTRSLHTYWAWDHMHQPATGVPLIALDMYEHAFHMDYGAAAAKYVDAYLRNLDWEVIDHRFQTVNAIPLEL